MEDPFDQVLSDSREQTNRLIQYLEAGHEIDDEIRDIVADLDESVRELDSSILVMKRDGNVEDGQVVVRETRMQELKRDVAKLKRQVAQSVAASSPRAPWSLAGGDNEDASDEHNSEQDQSQDPRSNVLQQEMLQEQDQHLSTIQQSMQNLHLQASTMGQELEDQGMLLDEMDGNMDSVMGKLSRGRRQLEWVYEKNKEKYNDCCIGLLIAALLVLLVLAFVL
ncbi:LADA_0G07580g1_1 [Lachancea dasiensis]|uniref:t-SNARE affecting a late Golgi compartment protein 1 n=1 Tax=Lachancea dasiensis TaxID=1072105 RepID=A0A1G4JTQ8_9SACH|nr:LADA_0G07580g1_1 [Lachancea dasiensis]